MTWFILLEGCKVNEGEQEKKQGTIWGTTAGIQGRDLSL